MAKDNFNDINEFIKSNSKTAVHTMNKSEKDNFSNINEFIESSDITGALETETGPVVEEEKVPIIEEKGPRPGEAWTKLLGKSAMGGLGSIATGVAGEVKMQMDIVESFFPKKLEKFMSHAEEVSGIPSPSNLIESITKDISDYWSPDIGDSTAKKYASMTTQSISATLPLMLTGKPTIALFGITTGGNKYLEMRREGASLPASVVGSQIVGASEALTEIPVLRAAWNPATKSTLKRVLKMLWWEQPGEQINTIVESIVDKMTIAKDMTFDQYLQRAFDTAIVTTMQVGVTGAAIHQLVKNPVEGESKGDVIRKGLAKEALEKGDLEEANIRLREYGKSNPTALTEAQQKALEEKRKIVDELIKTAEGRQVVIDTKELGGMPIELSATIKLNAQNRQAEIDTMVTESDILVEEAPKVAKAAKAPETTMQKIDRMISEIKNFGKDIGYKPPLERGKLQVPMGEKKPADTKLIEQDKRVQEVLSEIEKLEGLKDTAEKATGMDLKSIYDKAINEAINTLPEGEKIELQSAVSNFRKKVYVTGIEKYYAEKAAETKKVAEDKVAQEAVEKKKETAPVKVKESPVPIKRTMEESVAAGDIPAPEYKGKERREVPEARQTVIDGYVKKELGVKGLGGKKLTPLNQSEKEVLALYEAKHPEYVKKVREDIKGREEEVREPEVKPKVEPKISQKGFESELLLEKENLDQAISVAEKEGSFNGRSLSKLKTDKVLIEKMPSEYFGRMRDTMKAEKVRLKGINASKGEISKVEQLIDTYYALYEASIPKSTGLRLKEKPPVKIEAPEAANKTETLMADLDKLTTNQLIQKAKKTGLEQVVWSKAFSDPEFVKRHIVGKEEKGAEGEVKGPEVKPETKPEVEVELRPKFQDILTKDKLTQEDIKWLKENKEALDLSKEETQAIKMRIAGGLVKRIISEEKFQKNSESIKNYLKGLKVFTGIPDPKILKNITENAIYHIERGATNFYQWSSKMVKKFGEKIRPILHQAWTDAQNHINSARGYEVYKDRMVAGDKFNKVYIADSATASLQNESKIFNSYVSKGYLSNKQLDVDLTYSTGKMYERAGFEKPKRKFDIKPKSSDVEKANVVNSVPIENLSVNSVMFDPPFLVGERFVEVAKTYDKSKASNMFGDRFGSFKNLDEAVNVWGSGIAEASRILKLGGKLFVKIQDTVSLGGDPRLVPLLETGVTKTKSGVTRGKIPVTQYLIDVASMHKLNLIEGVSRVAPMTSHPEQKTIVNYMVFEKVKVPVVSPKISVSTEQYQKSLVNIKTYFKGEKPYGDKLHSGIGLDPQLISDLVRVMRFHIESGVKDFYQVSQKMIKEVGEWVRPHLKSAYDQAKGQIDLSKLTRKDLKQANDALIRMGLKTLDEAEAELISPETVNEPGLIKRFMSTLESTDQTLEAYKGGAQEHINAVPEIMVNETFIPKQMWLVDKFKQLDGAMKGVRRSIKAGELSRVGKEVNKLGREVSEVLELKDITEATGKYSPKSIEIAKDVRKILDDILVELQDANVLDKKGKLIKRLEGYFPHIKKEFSMAEDLQRYMNDALEGRHDDIIGAVSGGVDLYGTAKPVPKFGHAERRAAKEYGIQDVETNPLRVLRRYVLAASRILYDKPGIEKARAEIDMIPAGPMKDLSVKYIQNYMRVSDSISGTLRLVDAKLARMGARSVLAFSTGLQTLHLGRVATQIWPELGTRYSLIGLNELIKNPARAWAETRDTGLLPQSSIPRRFKFRGEVFDNISNYGDFGNSVAKIIAYQGFLRKIFNQHPDWTFKQIQTEAIKQTIRAEGVINQATKSIALEKIPKFFLQFKYWFQKYGENTSRAIAAAAKDPSMDNITRVGRYLTAAAITEEITRQLGLKIFHITPYIIQLSATGIGYLADLAVILSSDDDLKEKLEKAFKRTAQYTIPGGVSIPREITQGPTAIKKH